MLNVNDLEEIEYDLNLVKNKIESLRAIGLDDLGEVDGSEDFCESIFDAEEKINDALSALETIKEEG